MWVRERLIEMPQLRLTRRESSTHHRITIDAIVPRHQLSQPECEVGSKANVGWGWGWCGVWLGGEAGGQPSTSRDPGDEMGFLGCRWDHHHPQFISITITTRHPSSPTFLRRAHRSLLPTIPYLQTCCATLSFRVIARVDLRLPMMAV